MNYSAPPFLHYLSEIFRENNHSNTDIGNIIGMSQSSISRIISGKQIISDEFINNLITKYPLSSKQKEEMLNEYLNHKAWEIDPQYYGNVYLKNKNTEIAPSIKTETRRLIDFLTERNKTKPESTERLSSALFQVMESLQPPKR